MKGKARTRPFQSSKETLPASSPTTAPAHPESGSSSTMPRSSGTCCTFSTPLERQSPESTSLPYRSSSTREA